jgi:hypothetical protein
MNRGTYPRKSLLKWRPKVNKGNATNFPTKIPLELEFVFAGTVTRDFEPDEIFVVERNKLNSSQSGNVRLTAGVGE